jgi:hypothetical protein
VNSITETIAKRTTRASVSKVYTDYIAAIRSKSPGGGATGSPENVARPSDRILIGMLRGAARRHRG